MAASRRGAASPSLHARMVQKLGRRAGDRYLCGRGERALLLLLAAAAALRGRLVVVVARGPVAAAGGVPAVRAVLVLLVARVLQNGQTLSCCTNVPHEPAVLYAIPPHQGADTTYRWYSLGSLPRGLIIPWFWVRP